MKKTVLISVALLALIACTSGPKVARQDVLISLTSNVIVPSLETVAQEASELNDAVVALCDQPSEATLNEARSRWRDAKDAWMRSRAIGFGPAMDRRSRSFVDWWPVEPERIEKTLSSKDSVSSEYVREFLSTTQRGYGAIEYVLFEGDDVLSKLSDAATPRCEYLVALADVASAETSGLIFDWKNGSGGNDPYSEVFTGQASSALLPLAAVSETVRTSVFLLRSITDMQLGSAMGMNDGEADPTAIRGGPAHNGVADLRNQILGMKDAYTGLDGSAEEYYGIGALVAGLSEDADERMLASFDKAIDAIGQLEEPLAETIYTDGATAQAVYDALQELQVALNTEVVSLLGITVGFADTDGDGG